MSFTPLIRDPLINSTEFEIMHKHRWRLKAVRHYTYHFVCLCGRDVVFDKFIFRRLVTGWNPWKL